MLFQDHPGLDTFNEHASKEATNENFWISYCISIERKMHPDWKLGYKIGPNIILDNDIAYIAH